jgi:hypothetical protein
MQLASSRSIRSRAVLLRYSLDPPAQRPADGQFLGEVVRRNAAGLEPVYSGDLSKILTRAGEQDRLFTKEDITLPGSEVILLEPTKHS